MSLEETIARHDEQILTLFKNVDNFGGKIITKMDDILKELHLIQGRDDAGAIKKLSDRLSIVEKAMWAFGGAIAFLGVDKISLLLR